MIRPTESLMLRPASSGVGVKLQRNRGIEEAPDD